MKVYTFASESSKKTIVQIHQHIRTHGGATKHDLYLLTRLSEKRISQFLRHMTVDMGLIHKQATRSAGRDVWVDGAEPKPEIVEFVDDGIDYAPRKVKVSHSWIPHHVRDVLVAALFGAPTIQGEA